MIKLDTVYISDYKVVTITSGRLEQNCFLVKHLSSGDLLLIDPGEAVPEIMSYIESEGADLKLVLLTHAHFDHVSGIKPICEQYNLPFWIHSADIKLLKRAPIYAISMEKRILEISSNYKTFDGPVADWSGESIKIIHTPGHTAGSVCFSFGEMLFTGDIILREQKIKLDLPGFNDMELSKSISHILLDLPGETTFFPGHGKADSIANIRLWWEENTNRLNIENR